MTLAGPNLYFFMKLLILSPLSQFEVLNLIGINAPILGYLNINLTNIGFYLTISGLFILTLSLLSTNYNHIVSNK